MKHVLLVGGSGFLGQAIIRALLETGWKITVFDIIPGQQTNNVKYHVLDVRGGKLPTISECTAVINLAGAPINKRFTQSYKTKIWESRVITTRSIRLWLETQSWQPKIYIGASAIGYYGNRGNEILSENSKPGSDFLAEVCTNWEREHLAIGKLSIPVAILRQGNVIGNGGYVKELSKPYRYGLKAIPGNGQNYTPWIDIRDLVRIYIGLCNNEIPNGIYNAVSPIHIRFNDLAIVLSLHTRALLPLHIPVWILRLHFGEFADSIIASQRVQTSQLLLPFISHTNLSESIQFGLNSAENHQ